MQQSQIKGKRRQQHDNQLVDTVLEAIKVIGEQKGRPAFCLEICQFARKKGFQVQKNTEQVVFDLYREDMFYANNVCHQYSFEKFSNEYYKFSEKFVLLYQGYKLDEKMLIRPDTAKTVNLQKLKEILVSRDQQLMEQNKWIFDSEIRYLDGNDINGDKIAYATYPRTGSTFLRKYFENITGIATGSDMSTDLTLCIQMNGLKAEEIVDDSVWIYKTHFPFPSNVLPETMANKIVSCVRNPLDTICSFMQLVNNFTQTHVVKNEMHKEFPKFFKEFCLEVAKEFKEYYDLLISDAQQRKVPLYMIKYEDLVDNPQKILEETFSFILGVDKVEGTNVQQRIKDTLSLGQNANQVYKPKGQTFNRHAHKFNDELMKELIEILDDSLYFFGYIDIPSHENPHAFFNIAEHKEENLKKFNKFNDLNREHIEWVSYYHEEVQKIQYLINEPGRFQKVNLPDRNQVLDKLEILDK